MMLMMLDSITLALRGMTLLDKQRKKKSYDQDAGLRVFFPITHYVGL
jgi:hypothetical protein